MYTCVRFGRAKVTPPPCSSQADIPIQAFLLNYPNLVSEQKTNIHHDECPCETLQAYANQRAAAFSHPQPIAVYNAWAFGSHGHPIMWKRSQAISCHQIFSPLIKSLPELKAPLSHSQSSSTLITCMQIHT